MPIPLRLSGVAHPFGEEVIKLTSDALDAHVVAKLRGVHKRYDRVEACAASPSRSMRLSWWRCWAPPGLASPPQAASCRANAAPTPGRPGCSAVTRPWREGVVGWSNR